MKKATSTVLAFAAALIITLMPLATVHADTFAANRIIDDGIFNNTSTMSAAQIDSFLNTFTNSCISPNSGFRAVDPIGFSPTQGYKYGDYVTAGQAIYDASQAYSLNPQVLVVTLEKEQSLVTGRNNFSGYCNNGDQHKYAAAVGYGCPDSVTTYNYSGLNLYQRNGTTVSDTGTTCVNGAAKAGFSQQVIRAAWLFKFGQQRALGNLSWAVINGNWDNSDDPESCYSGPMTQGTFARCPSSAAAYYDGYATIDGTAVHIDSGATAALYWYTPHFHGNQNFFSLYTSWFGSTILACGVNEPQTKQVVAYYNPKTFDHFYTGYQCEGNILSIQAGYRADGAEFNTSDPATLPGAQPVYRLYNRTTGQHLWTISQDEIQSASRYAGYYLEGIAYYAAPSDPTLVPVYRLYNARTFEHIWTPKMSVVNLITSTSQFKMEGIAFYTQ